MSHIKQADLLRAILVRGVMDREAYLDAVRTDGAAVSATKAEIERIQALKGKSVREMMAADAEALRRACLYAESWFESVAAANHNQGKEADRASAMHAKVYRFRLSRFGHTALERELSTMKMVPLHEIHASMMSDRPPRGNDVTASMTTAELKVWIAGLKPGDRVAVHEHYGKVFLREAIIAKRTPTGRVVMESGETFKPNGDLFGSPVYAHRCLRPIATV